MPTKKKKKQQKFKQRRAQLSPSLRQFCENPRAFLSVDPKTKRPRAFQANGSRWIVVPDARKPSHVEFYPNTLMSAKKTDQKNAQDVFTPSDVSKAINHLGKTQAQSVIIDGEFYSIVRSDVKILDIPKPVKTLSLREVKAEKAAAAEDEAVADTSVSSVDSLPELDKLIGTLESSPELQNFVENRKSVLTDVTNGKSFEFEFKGKPYKIVSLDYLPDDMKYKSGEANLTGLAQSDITKRLDSMDKDEAIVLAGRDCFCVVHGSVPVHVPTNEKSSAAYSLTDMDQRAVNVLLKDRKRILAKSTHLSPQPLFFGGKNLRIVPLDTVQGEVNEIANITVYSMNDFDLLPNLKRMQGNDIIVLEGNHVTFAIIDEHIEIDEPVINEPPQPVLDDTDLDAEALIEQVNAVMGTRDQDSLDEQGGAFIEKDIQPQLTSVDDKKSDRVYLNAPVSQLAVKYKDNPHLLDVVNENNAIVLLTARHYGIKKYPIGFLVPSEDLKIKEHIKTTQTMSMRDFYKFMREADDRSFLSKTAKKICNKRTGDTVAYVPFDTALVLQKKGFFDDAPEEVIKILADAEEKIVNRAEARLAKKDRTSKVTPPKNVESVKTVVVKPAVENTTPDFKSASSANDNANPAQVDAKLAMRSLMDAIKTAKETADLIETTIGDISVNIGSDPASIGTMQEVIDFAQSMGAPTASVEILPFNAASITETMSSLKSAWEHVQGTDALVILEVANGNNFAITRNQDLVKAYKMS